MTEPLIELIPHKPAVCSDAPITLDVLIRITPPRPEVHFLRPPLNLGLVLDRSGSMSGGRKMACALEAASYVIQQLLPGDRVSVTTFDNEVETIVPSTYATDKPALLRRLGAIHPRGSTNLHGGWAEGARQVFAHRFDGGINRVLLLSDGLANEGVTDPNTLAAEARGRAAQGVSTTTLGVGDDYQEDLMEAMATAGDGRYYYIETATQLMDIFQTELKGLMATMGEKVSLGLEPASKVAVVEVLNDFNRAVSGRVMLPNLVVGMPILVVVRLSIAARSNGSALLEVRLAWDDTRSRERRVIRARLGDLRTLSLAAWSKLPDHPDVREQEVLLQIARAQREAGYAQQRGDLDKTVEWLCEARSCASTIPSTLTIEGELKAIDAIEAALKAGDHTHMRKMVKYRSYLRRTGHPSPPPAPGETEH
jgi:Ca-activated chloride channel family protein